MNESHDGGKTRRIWLAVVLAVLTIPAGIGIAIDTMLREGMPLSERIAKIGLVAGFVLMAARICWTLPTSASSVAPADQRRD